MKVEDRNSGREELLRGAAYEALRCNLCNGDDFEVLAERDCIGLAARTCFCLNCGLLCINPRPTKKWYGKYYASAGGLRRAYKRGGGDIGEQPGVGFESARRHGRALAERLRAFIKPGLTIDVGSAEGGLLSGMREVLPIEPVGIEPTVSRAEFARARGIPTYAALVEDITTVAPGLPPAANIVCTKSLNHFLDPAFFFRWAHASLEADGRLVLEVKNFYQQCRMSGRLRSAVQIDHPFMFVPETLSEFVRAAGFAMLFFEVDEEKSRRERLRQKQLGLPVGHIRLVARKTDRRPFAGTVQLRPALVRRLRRELSAPNLRVYYLVRYATPVRNMLQKFSDFKF